MWEWGDEGQRGDRGLRNVGGRTGPGRGGLGVGTGKDPGTGQIGASGKGTGVTVRLKDNELDWNPVQNLFGTAYE